MIFKIVMWAIIISIILWIAGVVLSFLPLIVLVAATAVALCCVYALLPENFRLPGIERWLDPYWEPVPRLPYSPGSPSPPKSDDSGSLPGTQPTLAQPPLDFTQIVPRSGKVPNREELVSRIKQKVIGQSSAIEVLVRVVLGKLAALKSPKPLVILLPGPTGTGKTEISKALAEALDVKWVRFDMGEYREAFKVSNLLGSARGYVGSDEGGALPNAIRQSKKRCVLLFDEVEKAHPSIWPQLLAFFDEGRVSDTIGSVVAPKDTICLLTSNLEAERIGENPEAAKDILKQVGYFPPEFLGRIDKIIPLLKLKPPEMAQLTVVLAKRFAAEKYGISLIIEQEALQELVSATHEEGEKYGGRGIVEVIGDLLTDDFLNLQIERTTQARLVVDGDRLRAFPLD